jgi:hypothetical protein
MMTLFFAVIPVVVVEVTATIRLIIMVRLVVARRRVPFLSLRLEGKLAKD